ncbi:3-oxoacyl-[acyl-carrier protein] reductase [Arthrobacter alpinus]|uniref:3-oxoacyl-[acyl-carrier protein] reductase n=1 Tax=Arthrobacter alpinus TaxID=656366 RepID=A0A1H5FBF8_9MICC|nr:SDR family oxidoreductase [Arthrobacter alpinus]SEE00716.1 3-oxoacyl-[acyl-carrier protein] reductase [Arthrobacter alpinus]
MTPSKTPTRVALVTGGSGGIGRAVVMKLAADGFAVGVHYSGNSGRAQSIADEVAAGGGQAITIAGDVSEPTAMTAAFDAVEAAFGGIDVVINTAGIMILSPVATLNLADLDRMHRINIRGTFVVSQLAANRLRRGGALINVSTSQTLLQHPGYAPYAASKAAVESLTLILARELRGKDITVNAVAPGPTATPLFLDGKDEQTVERLTQLAPLERLGTPEDIAQVAAFLAGPARWINGQVLFANGGIA